MKTKPMVHRFVWPIAISAVILVLALVSSSKSINAEDEERGDEARIRQGFEAAPVTLKVDEKNWKAVGLGSYLVNVSGDCNGCHSDGPQTEYLPGHNPYFAQKGKVNPATYLAGGRDFGKLEGPTSPDIISRNLTPDKTGLPAGGRSFEQFLTIMRTGKDLDHLHPNCSPTVTTNCLTPPFDGNLLQIMPWPNFADLTDHDLWAIYQYLKAIPCNESVEDPTNPLHNDCS